MGIDTGVYTTAELLDLGYCHSAIRCLLRQGRIIRLKHGWYARPGANPDVVAAIQARGKLGCLSACALYRLWIPPGAVKTPHLMLPRKYRPGPSTWNVHVTEDLPRAAIPSLEDCLRHVMRFHDIETALIVMESAVNKGWLTYTLGWELIQELPLRKQHLLRHFSDLAQSGSETRVRLFLQQRNVYVRPQIYLRGTGRVDLLVGKSLIIECDSSAHHSTEQNYLNDRDRDIQSELSGYRTLRLSYPHIWYHWRQTRLRLSAILRSRQHLNPPRQRTIQYT